MAATNLQVQSVQFSVTWTIKWSKFSKLSSSTDIRNIFYTSYNNVPLHWEAAFSVSSTDSSCIDFNLQYCNGPIEKFNNMEYAFSIVKADFSIAKTAKRGGYEARRGISCGLEEYFDKNPVAFRAKYGLEESHPLLISVTLKIPITVFSFTPTLSPSFVSQKWIDMFANVQDKEKSIGWNVKLISRNGAEFYCHKEIIFQFESLRNMFNPQAAGKPENEFKCPLISAALKYLIQFLYTGQADLGNLDTLDLISLTSAVGKHKPLKEAFAVVLWKEAKNPMSCIKIFQCTRLHDDLKYLQYRAMDVVAELLANNDDNDEILDDFHGQDEFPLFLSRRVVPCGPVEGW